MSFLSLSQDVCFLSAQLSAQHLLEQNHRKMGLLLSLIRRRGLKGSLEALIKSIVQNLEAVQRMNQKALGYLGQHQSSSIPIGHGDESLIAYSQENVHLFLEQHYVQIRTALHKMARDPLLQKQAGVQTSLAIFSRYLSLNQSVVHSVLEALRKITKAWETLFFRDRSFLGVSGSEQFSNLMAYCKDWA